MTYSQSTDLIIMTVIHDGKSIHINDDMIIRSLKKLTSEPKSQPTHDRLLTPKVA